MTVAAFRDKVRHYRQLAGVSQEALAREIGLHPCVLSRKLHARSMAYLTVPEIKKMIVTLAARGVLTSREQVLELLTLTGLGSGAFRPNEWGAPPLRELGDAGQDLLAADGITTPRVRATTEDAADRVLTLLRQDGVRAVTLTGGVGVGKTSTALRVGTLAVGLLADAVYPVDLRPVRDVTGLWQAVADALGATYGRPVQVGQLRSAVDAALRLPGRVLLILDGVAHLDAVRSVAAELLATYANVRVLLTSCCPLLVVGHEVQLAG